MSTCDPLLDRVKQLGAAVEASCGAGHTFTNADFKARISSATVETNMSPIEDDTLTATLSPRPIVMGEKLNTVQVSARLVGSGVAGTKPESDVLLRGCGMVSAVLNKIPIGAVTGGPFLPGEVITQATSLATGRVMRPCIDGDDDLYFIILSGTWNGTGEITGGASTATATPSAVHAADGHVYHPVSNGQETIALRLEEDGRYKETDGAMGTLSMSSDSSGVLTAEFTFQGKKGDYGDAALTAGVTYATTAFPTATDARCILDRGLAGEYQPVVRSISIDFQSEAVVRKDANDATGLIAAQITGRVPQIVLTAEAMTAAEFDVYTKMADADLVTLGFQWTAPDNKVSVWGTNAQIVGNPEGSADGFSTMDLTFRMNGSAGDDELWIVFST